LDTKLNLKRAYRSASWVKHTRRFC